MAKSNTTILDAARRWLDRGYFPIPVPHATKRPLLDGWPRLRLTGKDLPHFFSEPGNIGVLLGAPYGAADIDLDCAEALAAWPEFAPQTALIFGRKSAPRSHYFYRSDPPLKSVKYTDPLTKDVVLELRCLKNDGEVGFQTIVPPSVHESGEEIRFDLDGEAGNVDVDVLQRAAARTAGAVLLARHFPAEGSRNAAFLALAGILAREGWPEADAKRFAQAIYRCLWPQAPDLAAAGREVEGTYRRLREGREVTGYARLKELIEQRALRAAMRWLDADGEIEPPTLVLDAKAAAPEIATLNGLKIFSGLLRFASFKKRGPVIVGTLENGTEIVWHSAGDLIHFARAQSVIADAAGVLIPTPLGARSKITKTWEPVAELALRIAGRDSQPGGSSLAEEFSELLPMVWQRARRPKAELPETLIATLKLCSRHVREPQAEPPECCVWWVQERMAAPECWVHVPSLLSWLSAPVATGKRYDWAESREALWLLGFTYRKDLHRSFKKEGAKVGVEAKASVWIGPAGILRE